MYTLILILLVSFIVSFAAVPLIKRLAPVVGAMDVPQSSLQIHTRPIPRLGGLAIFFGFMAAALVAILFGNPISAEAKGLMLPLLVGATAMLLLGTIDDIRGLQPHHRFAVQIPVAIFLIRFGIKINIPSLLPLGIALTVFYVIGSCNSMNLLDGVDGLAAGVTAIASLAFGIVFLIQGQTQGLILSIALLGSTLGFLRHNLAPASIFMGDSGSLFLGFMLAVLAILYLRTVNDMMTFLVPMAILGVPVFDTACTLIRRSINHKPLMPGDRGHCYDKLMDGGLTTKQSVFVVYGMGIVFAITGILFTEIGVRPALILLICEMIALAFMIRRFDMLSLKQRRQHKVVGKLSVDFSK